MQVVQVTKGGDADLVQKLYYVNALLCLWHIACEKMWLSIFTTVRKLSGTGMKRVESPLRASISFSAKLGEEKYALLLNSEFV